LISPLGGATGLASVVEQAQIILLGVTACMFSCGEGRVALKTE